MILMIGILYAGGICLSEVMELIQQYYVLERHRSWRESEKYHGEPYSQGWYFP